MISRRDALRFGVSFGLSITGCTRVAPGGAMRLVSTSPSMTESIFSVGRGDVLFGRSSFCDEPPEARNVEVIGGFSDPNLEKILALSPTLVCGERGPAGPEFVASLERHGIATYFPPIDRLRDVGEAITGLGAKVDAVSKAKEVAAAIDATLDGVRKRVETASRVKVVMLFDWKPLVAAGPESFCDDLLAAAGATNLVTSGGKYPKLSVEGLLGLDPDVVLDGSAGAYAESPAQIASTIAGLEALRAAKSGQLHRLPGTSALRPGPRLAAGVESIARILHPGAFADAR